jgi:ABC-type multidrug transport system fused ATPase/permease subunit
MYPRSAPLTRASNDFQHTGVVTKKRNEGIVLKPPNSVTISIVYAGGQCVLLVVIVVVVLAPPSRLLLLLLRLLLPLLLLLLVAPPNRARRRSKRTSWFHDPSLKPATSEHAAA